MRTIFYGAGPGFRRGITVPWIKMVDQYQVFAHLLGIDGEENMGNWERVRPMLV